MKYYAVTEDPNELLHWGRRGMKWGKHIFGDEYKKVSEGYKRAVNKLMSLSAPVKNTINKSVQQHNANKKIRQQEKFNKAVLDAQKRISATENMHKVDNITAFERDTERKLKEEKRMAKQAAKEQREYDRVEKNMNKYLQKAREGKLKYGKLHDDQVQRITERLNAERVSRSLNGGEQKFRSKLKNALQEGILQGVAQGTAAGMKEVAVAKVQNRLMNRHALNKQNKIEAHREHDYNRIKNNRSRHEIRKDVKKSEYENQLRREMQDKYFRKNAKQDIRNEAYKQALEDGKNAWNRFLISDGSATHASRKLEQMKSENEKKLEKKNIDKEEAKRIRDVQARITNDRDERLAGYIEDLGYTSEREAAKNITGMSKHKVNRMSDEEVHNVLLRAQTQATRKAYANDTANKIINDEVNNIKMDEYADKVHDWREQKHKVEKAIKDAKDAYSYNAKAIEDMKKNGVSNSTALSVINQEQNETTVRLHKLESQLETIKNSKPEIPALDVAKPLTYAEQRLLDRSKVTRYNNNNNNNNGGKKKRRGNN